MNQKNAQMIFYSILFSILICNFAIGNERRIDYGEMIDNPERYDSLFYKYLDENNGELPTPSKTISGSELEAIKRCISQFSIDSTFYRSVENNLEKYEISIRKGNVNMEITFSDRAAAFGGEAQCFISIEEMAVVKIIFGQ